MKLRTIIFAIIFLFIYSAPLFSQTPEVRFGEPYKIKPEFLRFSMMGKADKVFVLSYNLRREAIAKLSEGNYNLGDFTELKSPPADFEDEKNTVLCLGIFPTGDSYLGFYQAFTKDKKAITFAATLDLNGIWGNKIIPIDTGSNRSINDYWADNVQVSADSLHFLFIKYSRDTKDTRTVLKLYDKDAKMVYATKQAISFNFIDSDLSRYFKVDSHNNIIAFTGIGATKEKRANQGVYIYNAANDAFKTLPISLPGGENKFAQDAKLMQDEKGNIYLTGLYGEGKGKPNGIFIYPVDAEGDIFSHTWTYNFGTDFKVIEKEKDNLHFEQLFNLADNSIVAVFNYDHVELAAGNNSKCVSLNILGLKINPDGKIAYTFNVLKKQSMIDDKYYLSAGAIKTKNYLYFIYNDDVKNLAVNDENNLSNYSGTIGDATPVIAKVDLLNGQVTRNRLFDQSPEKNNPAIKIRTLYKMDDNKYLVSADFEKFGKSRFIEITMK